MSKDGHCYWCKVCSHKSKKQYQDSCKLQNDNPYNLMSKMCRTCNKEQLISEFHKDRGKKDGFRGECKQCVTRYSKKNWKKYKETSRRGSLRRIGWTLEEYDRAFKKQNGLCAICGEVDMTHRRLAADHNHKTGKNRELLCQRCNTVLGRVYENTDLLHKLIKYIDKS